MNITTLCTNLGLNLTNPYDSYLDSEIINDYILKIVLSVATYVAISFLIYLVVISTNLFPRTDLTSNCRVLFITAHPDDECMFFGPTILHSTSNQPENVYLLCLSTGNYRQEGFQRTKELWNACANLKILKSHVFLINSTKIPDSPTVLWDLSVIAKIVIHFVEALGIEKIVTFDENGVSGHSNHKRLYQCLHRLVASREISSRLFVLDSVVLPRKYFSFFDILLTTLFEDYIYLSKWRVRNQISRAMHAHTSQMVWFRRLYLVFSRYLFINSFKEICADHSVHVE